MRCAARPASAQVDIDDVDFLGRPNALPNIMRGDGVDDSDYAIMVAQGLLTRREVAYIQKFPGFKCQVPLKWALTELRELCQPEVAGCDGTPPNQLMGPTL